MFLQFRPLLYSLIFLGGLELVIANYRLTGAVFIFLFLFSLLKGKELGRRWLFCVLPIFFIASSITLLYLITLKYEQQIFIILAAGMYYLSLLGAYRLGKSGADQTARGMNMAAATATIFFTYAGAYGFYLNFLVPIQYLMGAYMLVTLLVSYQYFTLLEKEQKRTVWVYSFLLALIMTELIWTMNFWPFGYLTTGVIALILYYILWDLTQNYFLGILSKKRVVVNMVFFSCLILLVLLSSKWLPVT